MIFISADKGKEKFKSRVSLNVLSLVFYKNADIYCLVL